uniref:EB domain-containing protein n=1 Tax=Steinernema glaseri TaxID=37863 RepID=A0A1I7ZW66_9BILA
MRGRLVFLLFLLCSLAGAERCPPIFGDSECPLGLVCTDGKCTGEGASENCDVLTCPENMRCFNGRCYPTENLPCNRNVLVGENAARSIVSDCGIHGKCVNGRCVLDRCAGVSCGLQELCLDGVCTNMTDRFCLSSFDCGPTFDCVANKCQDSGVLSRPICSCDPDQVCGADGTCAPRPKCSRVFCGPGAVCVDGFCSSTEALACSRDDECGAERVCRSGTCAPDLCVGKRCPPDHQCREGECRLLQGLLCHGECPAPFECVSGRCARNECARKVCQLGETCDGFCQRVEGRFCSLAIRDCGEGFACENNACRDQLKPVATK